MEAAGVPVLPFAEVGVGVCVACECSREAWKCV